MFATCSGGLYLIHAGFCIGYMLGFGFATCSWWPVFGTCSGLCLVHAGVCLVHARICVWYMLWLVFYTCVGYLLGFVFGTCWGLWLVHAVACVW